MASINKVIILGNLGTDPDQKQLSSTNVCEFSVATSYKDNTTWHRVKAFGKLGELCSQYLHKGSQVYVEGRIETRMHEKDGVKKYYTDIVADNVQFLGGKSNNQSSYDDASSDSVPF